MVGLVGEWMRRHRIISFSSFFFLGNEVDGVCRASWYQRAGSRGGVCRLFVYMCLYCIIF